MDADLRAALKKLHDLGQDGVWGINHKRWIVLHGSDFVRALNEAHSLLYDDNNEELT